MVRKSVTFSLIAMGIVWSALFPKKASFDFDMVMSVAFGLGLIGSGVILLLATKLRRSTTALSMILLWSLLANVGLYSWVAGANQVLAGLMEAPETPPGEGR